MPTPSISSISPAKVTAGTATSTLTISGSGFLSTSTVAVGGSTEASTYVSGTQLTATVPATQMASGAELAVTVANGASSSSAADLEVDNPQPAITAMSPTTGVAGTASAVITITGSGFDPATVVEVNGSARATTFINATQVSAALPSTDFATSGSLAITAVNPTPGGGTSTAATLAIDNPSIGPVILTPSTLTVGSTKPTTITVTGTGFIAASVVTAGATARATSYVNGTTLTFSATAADQATAGELPVTVSNPAPGGGSSPVAYLNISQPAVTPVITSLTPNSFVAGSGSSSITVVGTGFTTNTVVQWNGVNLPTSYESYFGGTGPVVALLATVPAADVATTGTATVTVDTPNASPSVSNAMSVSIANPPAPTLTGLSPNGGPIGTASAETITGTGFTANTTISLNGAAIPATFVSSTELTATFPALALATPGNQSVTVMTPAPGGGTSAPQVYTTYLSLPNNDIVYNAADGLLYASVPASAAGSIGNAVVAIDPNTGSITRTIQVGTNPNKLALSTDGTQLFVGIDGAAAVAQVNLAQGKIVNQFGLGGGPGVYNPPATAAYLAAVPGLPNSVAVATTGGIGNSSGVAIFDSGVARVGSSSSAGTGPLSFGSSAATLYVAGSAVEALTVGSSGITSALQLATATDYGGTIALQYDNGALYLSDGQVFNASTGALNGTFYTTGTTQASGPVVSDSTLGKAFFAASSESNYNDSNAVYVFDESNFGLIGTIPVNGLGAAGYPTSFRKIVRWGQNGIAVAAVPSAFTSNNQIYIFQSPLVKDVSSAPADLSVVLTAPSTATTGTPISFVAKVVNAGPNSATGAGLFASVDPSLIINSITASQGSCTTAATFACDLGELASGATATVTVSATATSSGTLSTTASVASSSYDPNASNDQSSASTTVTGSLYGAVPSISSISPNLVQAGSVAFALTVNGNGFNPNSTVDLGATALATTYISATQLTASVTADAIANYGWAAVTVSNPTPGGGVSSVVPLTIYDLVNVPANAMLFDPWSQSLYATVPSDATGLTGNSVVAINPFTGTVGTPVSIGSQPTVMAETSDGDYLYVGLSGANSLAKFDLLNQSLVATIPMEYDSQSTPAYSLAAMPGTDNTLAVGISSGYSFALFDVNGSTGTFRSNISGIYEGTNPVFASPTELYAYDNQTSGAEFYRYSINANGLSLIDGTTLDGMGGFSGGFQGAGGLVYGFDGGIIDPSTTPPSQVQTLPPITFYAGGDTGYGVALAADASLGKEFIMLENTAGTWAYGVARYDLGTYLPEAVLQMPQAASGIESTWTLDRFGQDGLALLSYNNDFGSAPVVQMLLVRGPFIAPQELSTESAASLMSSSASSVTHGSGNTALTLTGANFLHGVAVTWNGAYRTTTIVDSSHVTVEIPASDLTSTGSASLVATNPGAPASNALQINVN